MFAQMPIIQGILYGSTQRGARLSELCDAIGISQTDLGDSEFKVPFEQACLTWECCAKQTNDNLLGLHLGEVSTMSVLGLVGNLMQSSPDLLSAFEKMTHYIDLATDMIIFGVKQNAHEVILTYKPKPLWLKTGSVSIRHSMEQSMAGTLHVFRLLTGKKIKPIKAMDRSKIGYACTTVVSTEKTKLPELLMLLQTFSIDPISIRRYLHPQQFCKKNIKEMNIKLRVSVISNNKKLDCILFLK